MDNNSDCCKYTSRYQVIFVIIDYFFVFVGADFVAPRSEELGIAT